MSRDRGCGDHSCLVAPPVGIGTNGGCRCGESVLRREVSRLRAALATAERERDEARARLREASAFASAMRLAFDRSDSRHAECVHAARRYMDAAAPQTPSEGGTDD